MESHDRILAICMEPRAECRRQFTHQREQASGEGSGRASQWFAIYSRATLESERDEFWLNLEIRKRIRGGCEHSTTASNAVSATSADTSAGSRGNRQYRTLNRGQLGVLRPFGCIAIRRQWS